MNSNTSCPNGELHNVKHSLESGEFVCIKCGEVIQDHAISLEWSLPRRNNKDETGDKNISSEVVSEEDRILGETFNPRFGDAVDLRLKRANLICQKKPWSENKILIGIKEIKMFVEKFKLSRNVRKNAIFSFRKVIPKNELRARKIQLIALVLVDYWAKQDNNPIQMDVIQKEFSYSQHIFMDYKQLLYRLLHFALCPVNPGQYVIKICESLQVNYEVLSCGKKIVEYVATRENLSGCDPKGFAAGSIYFACCIKGQRRSQMDVSTAAGVSDITLRSRLKVIQKYTRHFSSF